MRIDFRAELTPQDWDALQHRGRLTAYAAGTVIDLNVRQHLLFVLTGGVTAGPSPATQDHFGPGMLVSEWTLLLPRGEGALMRVSEEATVLVVEATVLEELIVSVPKLAAKLYRLFAKALVYRVVRPETTSERCEQPVVEREDGALALAASR